MSITFVELEKNIGKYLLLAQKEDIYILHNGTMIAKLSNPNQDRIEIAKSLFGAVPAEMTLEEAQEERWNTI